MGDESGNLVAPLAQRPDRQADDVEAVEEIFAEPAGAHRVFEVGVGGGDDADVDGESGGLAERGDLARLEEAEQLRLQVEAQLADFVEEEGAVAGAADEAGVVAVGAGERAAAVAEELAFEQVAGHGGAIEGDEGLPGAIGEVVDGAGENLLAGAAVAGDEDIDVGGSDAAGEGHQLAHVAGDDGVVAAGGEVLDGPQRGSFVAFQARAFELFERIKQKPDRIETSDRFKI